VCTLILAWRVFSDAPVVVAANRDEAVDRPSVPPERRDWEGRPLAPMDERAGGTWMGVNTERVFVGITNRKAETASERSRGLLVKDALGAESAKAARERVLAELDVHEYDGFNLVLADDENAYLLEWDGELTSSDLDPGVHVVVNTGYAPPDRVGRVQEALPEPVGGADAWLDRVRDVLGDHDVGACIHHESEGFATRSSSLLRIDGEGRVRFDFADGPPCRTEYEPVNDHI